MKEESSFLSEIQREMYLVFQGRSLSSSGLRYITVLLDEDQPKIFGLDTINHERTTYITEGPFDSLLIDNSLAMAGADVFWFA